jgi:hypothetical protein
VWAEVKQSCMKEVWKNKHWPGVIDSNDFDPESVLATQDMT